MKKSKKDYAALQAEEVLEEVRKSNEQSKRLFRPKALELADEVCRRINAEVPDTVEGIKYARPATLEWVITLLQDRV